MICQFNYTTHCKTCLADPEKNTSWTFLYGHIRPGGRFPPGKFPGARCPDGDILPLRKAPAWAMAPPSYWHPELFFWRSRSWRPKHPCIHLSVDNLWINTTPTIIQLNMNILNVDRNYRFSREDLSWKIVLNFTFHVCLQGCGRRVQPQKIQRVYLMSIYIYIYMHHFFPWASDEFARTYIRASWISISLSVRVSTCIQDIYNCLCKHWWTWYWLFFGQMHQKGHPRPLIKTPI